MTSYQMQMGFDLNSAILTGTSPDQNLYPLQNALVDMTDGETPAWYTQLVAGDEIEFWFFNISTVQARGSNPEFTHPEITLAFADPESGQSVWPFLNGEAGANWSLFAVDLGPTTSPVYSVGGKKLPTSYRAAIDGGSPYTFTLKEGFFKVSARLQVTNSETGQPMNFVFDPEWIVNTSGG